MEGKVGRRDETGNLGENVKLSSFVDGGCLRAGVPILQASPGAEGVEKGRGRVGRN